ncbi:hypothetical protein Daura_21725 [Dactylosporangium aurantiacum]|uniref:Uncharacterized protein n=1 Tax=Dactylosporangium aurantiacum TaxID=35754 RepID=A0A9Q9ISH3_9ACTN|nr:hypothetical protein [Dactylosporangium aurantiacum]MDG6110321.1 hypothetical protein [Dactylosporangium aurantiacum]UWZ58560.1 hypothetical protein Daura_21725 [Dactylosporangium aurantiacum]
MLGMVTGCRIGRATLPQRVGDRPGLQGAAVLAELVEGVGDVAGIVLDQENAGQWQRCAWEYRVIGIGAIGVNRVPRH